MVKRPRKNDPSTTCVPSADEREAECARVLVATAHRSRESPSRRRSRAAWPCLSASRMPPPSETVLEPQTVAERARASASCLAEVRIRVRSGEDRRAGRPARRRASGRRTCRACVWICHVRPRTLTGPAREHDHPGEPDDEQDDPPGTTNRNVALCTSMNRTCRQASGTRLSFESPTRGRYVIGTSSIRSPCFASL